MFARDLTVELCRKTKESCRGAVLQRGRSAHIDQIMEVTDRWQPLAAGSQVAEPPTGDAEGFGEAGDSDGPLGHAGKRRQADMFCAVVEEILVDLICENEEVVLNSDFSDQLE